MSVKKAIPLDRLDRLTAAALKMQALLLNACGEQGEGFRLLNDDIQDNYMMACADLAQEIVDVLKGGAA